jgi:protein-tyrosine phosphatase
MRLQDSRKHGGTAMSMNRIWERLFLGSWHDAVALSTANPDDIETVITLSIAPVLKKRRGVNYLHLPVEDAQPISVGQVDAILDAIAENIRWGKVLVHCGEGISRAPIMVAAYMHTVGYKNIDAALKEIATVRPIIDPSDVLLNSVKEHLG